MPEELNPKERESLANIIKKTFFILGDVGEEDFSIREEFEMLRFHIFERYGEEPTLGTQYGQAIKNVRKCFKEYERDPKFKDVYKEEIEMYLNYMEDAINRLDKMGVDTSEKDAKLAIYRKKYNIVFS